MFSFKLHSLWHLFSALAVSVRLGYFQFLYYEMNDFDYSFVHSGLNIFFPYVKEAKQKKK
jgi:hypothetical protein